MYAAAHGHLNIVSALIQAGARVNHQDKVHCVSYHRGDISKADSIQSFALLQMGYTALMRAIQAHKTDGHSRVTVISILLMGGARTDLSNTVRCSTVLSPPYNLRVSPLLVPALQAEQTVYQMTNSPSVLKSIETHGGHASSTESMQGTLANSPACREPFI